MIELHFATSSGTAAIALSSGQYHNCALLNDSSVICWGDNSFGQLGIGSSSNVGTAPGQMGSGLLPVNLGQGAFSRALWLPKCFLSNMLLHITSSLPPFFASSLSLLSLSLSCSLSLMI